MTQEMGPLVPTANIVWVGGDAAPVGVNQFGFSVNVEDGSASVVMVTGWADVPRAAPEAAVDAATPVEIPTVFVPVQARVLFSLAQARRLRDVLNEVLQASEEAIEISGRAQA